MLRQALEVVSWLIFPTECETCKDSIPPLPASGICARCDGEIGYIKPPHCVSCGRTVGPGIEKCSLCAEEHYHYDRAIASAFYEGKMKDALHAYKFGRRKYLSHYLSRRLSLTIDGYLENKSFEAVVAVPLGRERKKERGFNQAELLSRRLAKTFGIPDASSAFKRRHSDIPQSRLKKTERKRNISDSFEVRASAPFRGKNLLLVDDVLTTGATASECARVLKEAGAQSVTVLACARGL